MLARFLTRVGIAFMRVIGRWPLPLVRALGWCMGWCLYLLIPARRHVVMVNLSLCFPEQTIQHRRAEARKIFVIFAQTWLDRGWLWHGSPQTTASRLRLVGDVAQLEGNSPTVLFAPHFMGLDAGATALSQNVPRQFSTIFTPQSNKAIDAWIARGRNRFGNADLYDRMAGIKPVLSALRAGNPLYLLPDMDFGENECVFVPFFGVQTATVPSLSRFARLGRAKVVPVLTRMTHFGYEVKILPAWEGFPSSDAVADTALMNQRLQDYIATMPEQYYWVHKRFKTRPPGDADVYAG
jgi:KDO2-lipid IV(A) lauroyltransferase